MCKRDVGEQRLIDQWLAFVATLGYTMCQALWCLIKSEINPKTHRVHCGGEMEFSKGRKREMCKEQKEKEHEGRKMIMQDKLILKHMKKEINKERDVCMHCGDAACRL